METKFMGVTGFFMCLLLMASSARSQSVEELMAQGDGLLKNGAYAEAVTVFRKIISQDPRNFEAQSNLAFSYLQSERYSNAVTEYNKAISLSPHSAESWLNLGYAYRKIREAKQSG